MSRFRVSTRDVAFVAMFAALYYVLSIISPGIPAIGHPDIKIKLEALMATVFGLILGPYLGSLTAFLGAFVAWVLPPGSMSPFGLPFLPSPVMNALVAGLIYRGKWKAASVVFGVLIAAFWFLPPSQPLDQYYYVAVAATFDKIIAWLLIIPTVVAARRSSSQKTLPILYFFLAFIGNQADSQWGVDVFAVPVVYEKIFQIPDLGTVRFLFVVSPFIYPAIRIIQAVIAVLIAVPLIRTLKSAELIPIEGIM